MRLPHANTIAKEDKHLQMTGTDIKLESTESTRSTIYFCSKKEALRADVYLSGCYQKIREVDQSMCLSDEKGLETNVYLLSTENWRECFRHELLWLDQCLTFSLFILSSFLLVNSSAKNYYGDVYSKQSLELKYMFFIRRSKMFLPSGNVW